MATQIIPGTEAIDTSRYECIEGQLVERPLPTIRHSCIQDNLGSLLRPLTRSRGMQSGPELSVDRSPGSGSDWMTPDYALSLPGGYRANANGHALPPVFLVIEVLSASQSFVSMRSKVERYLNWVFSMFGYSILNLRPRSSSALISAIRGRWYLLVSYALGISQFLSQTSLRSHSLATHTLSRSEIFDMLES